MRNYVEQDVVERIDIRRTNVDNEYQTVATIYPKTGMPVVKMVIGNIDQFLENLEQVQATRVIKF